MLQIMGASPDLLARIKSYTPASGARTVRGRLRSALAYARYARPGWSSARPTLEPWTPRAKRWTETQREDLRAAHDRRFRRVLLARLRREIARLNAPRPLTLAKITAWADRRSRAAAREIAGRIAGIIGHAPRVALPAQTDGVEGVALLHNGSCIAARLGARICRRGARPTIYPTLETSYYSHMDGWTDWSRGRGSPRTGAHAVNESYYRSFAVPSPDGGTVAVAIHTTEYALSAPSGYRWGIDANGLRLVDVTTPDSDYHPSASECWHAREDGGAALVAAIVRNVETRRRDAEIDARNAQEKAARRAVLLAESDGVCVGLCDSITGGNCGAGSRAWATAHGLDPSRYYRASRLLAAGNGEYQRVRRAVLAAIRRQRAEEVRAQEIADAEGLTPPQEVENA